jgi:hypothetical protein
MNIKENAKCFDFRRSAFNIFGDKAVHNGGGSAQFAFEWAQHAVDSDAIAATSNRTPNRGDDHSHAMQSSSTFICSVGWRTGSRAGIWATLCRAVRRDASQRFRQMPANSSAAASSWKTVHQLHWYAARCIVLSDSRSHAAAKQILRRLAVDLLDEAEKQRRAIRQRSGTESGSKRGSTQSDLIVRPVLKA